SFISKLEARWEQLLEEDPNKYLADVIMANIHNLSIIHGDVSLVGFNNEEVHVDFKGKSPIKFAENLYRKSKNRKIEIAKTEEHLEDKQKELEAVRKEISQLNDAVDLSDVKTFSLKKASQEIQKTPVFHEIEINGFKVLIGKNSKNNDKLTFGEGFKEDLWLHVKDAPGSHVLIKYQSGKTFPSDVIEFAAQQAAFFSKRKTESWVPVIYTPRKFIRKRKGAPAGEVVVEKEGVILVQPVSHLR
ncbi:MAG: NFACT RNA binding domain-containing protein, partial [Cyclobacteriaceae bacterium]|nr:NFACT RNA binding domain-containing protein [Cyclobacteriaceae bacterium]